MHLKIAPVVLAHPREHADEAQHRTTDAQQHDVDNLFTFPSCSAVTVGQDSQTDYAVIDVMV